MYGHTVMHCSKSFCAVQVNHCCQQKIFCLTFTCGSSKAMVLYLGVDSNESNLSWSSSLNLVHWSFQRHYINSHELELEIIGLS